ncbi:MAG TPA: hypothetical protein VLW53_07980, partial [Candidatus Eisenbacteria bacterium]|nr:hypothetical protein [Candidatus Eisenbacteria bacterium]
GGRGGRGGASPVPAGGGGGGDGGFVPWRGGGFQAVAFWAGAIAEFAATAVPALVAAGAATLVGMQGAQDIYGRAKAISAAAGSIGPAYGQSVSSYIGTSGALGRYQDQARGGVYDLAGLGISFLNSGKGTFGQFGTDTLAMIDRGAADMLINYQARQASGGGLGGMLGDGSKWLRRYGDLGSNLGDVLMNMAPYEAGIGGDVLQGLVGATGFLKQASQDIPGPLLGALMAVEGGHRWGKAALSGEGLLGRVLGLGKAGGIGGLLGKAGGALAEGAPLGSGLESLGFGLSGIGGGLAEFGGPISIAAALSAYGMSYLASTMPTAAQRRVAGLQAGIGQAGFSAALTPLAQALVTTQGLAAKGPAGGLAALQQVQTPYEIGRFGPGITPTYRDTYNAASQGFAQTTADLVNAGPQLVDALKKAGLKSVSMADAFQIAQNALLDTSHAFGKDGKLTKTALTMVAGYETALKPMTQSGGGFNAAIAAGQIMGSPAMKDLANVNQVMDQATGIMTGGPAGMAALFGMLGGTPTTITRGGRRLRAPALSAMAGALTSFTTAGGAAAWNTFAGQNGLISTEQQNLDQLRTYMTLNALSLPQARGIAGFQLQQLLPMAKNSPAGLAMLMQQGQQMGIGGYYDPSKSQAQNYQDMVRSTSQVADNVHKVNRDMNHAVVAASNLPKTAAQFSQSIGADIQSKLAAAASADVVKLKTALGHAGSGALIGDLVSQFRTAGFKAGPALMSGINATLKQAGFSAAQIKAIDLKVKADTSQAQAAINGVHGKTVHVPTKADVAAAQAAINSVHGKTVTITVVENILAGNLSIPGAGPGGVPYTPAGVAANAPGVYTHRQAGGRIPGYGGGDIVPLMAEPGELILPKHAAADPLAVAVASKYKVPGYAAGGFVGQQVLGPMAYWGAGSSMARFNPAWYAQILAAMQASQGAGEVPRMPV